MSQGTCRIVHGKVVCMRACYGMGIVVCTCLHLYMPTQQGVHASFTSDSATHGLTALNCTISSRVHGTESCIIHTQNGQCNAVLAVCPSSWARNQASQAALDWLTAKTNICNICPSSSIAAVVTMGAPTESAGELLIKVTTCWHHSCIQQRCWANHASQRPTLHGTSWAHGTVVQLPTLNACQRQPSP